MTFRRRNNANSLIQPGTQPTGVYENLFNLIMRARERSLLFSVLDTCESEFSHRDLSKLTLPQQRRLYHLARDEVARDKLEYGWTCITPHTETMQ